MDVITPDPLPGCFSCGWIGAFAVDSLSSSAAPQGSHPARQQLPVKAPAYHVVTQGSPICPGLA